MTSNILDLVILATAAAELVPIVTAGSIIYVHPPNPEAGSIFQCNANNNIRRSPCQKFGIAPYVEAIAGPAVGGTDTKADVMRRILAGLGPVEKGDAVMVGDRRFDIIGAHELGLPVIYVTYGYGDEAERKAFQPEYTAATVGDLKQLLLQA